MRLQLPAKIKQNSAGKTTRIKKRTPRELPTPPTLPKTVIVYLYSNKRITNTNIESLRQFLNTTFGHVENEENDCKNKIKDRKDTTNSTDRDLNFVLQYDDICVTRFEKGKLQTELDKLKENPLQIISERLKNKFVYIQLAPINKDFD